MPEAPAEELRGRRDGFTWLHSGSVVRALVPAREETFRWCAAWGDGRRAARRRGMVFLRDAEPLALALGEEQTLDLWTPLPMSVQGARR